MSSSQKSSSASSLTSTQQKNAPPPLPPVPVMLPSAPAPAPIVISESVVDVPVAPVEPVSPVIVVDEVVAPVEVQAQVIIPQSIPVPQQQDNILLTRLAQLYEYAKSILDTKKITTTNIIMIMNNLIQIVEQYKELTGNQKKMLVLDTIKKIINENVTDDNDKQQLILFVNITLPVVLDSIILAINGDMKFAKEKITGCFSKLFSCCKCSK